MSVILDTLARPLGWVIYVAYTVTGSVGWAVVLFSVIAKLILFPLTRMAHLNSIRLLRLQPALDTIKKYHAHDKERINEEQYNLFQKERYNPLLGILPLLAQLVLLVGMLQVMYNPLYHMRLPYGADLTFLGIDLGAFHIAMPFASGIAALAFALVQNFISPGALSQGRKTNVGLILFTVGLSVYFAVVTPAGVGLYWTVGNLFAIVTVCVLYLMYNPFKLAEEALEHKRNLPKPPTQDKSLKAREKSDAARFMATDKRLVFYAISGGQYKYYKTIIDYLLANSDIVIHYLTNDPADGVFNMDNPRLIPYYVGQGRAISLMLKLECDMVITTVPDLQTFHIKRSIVRNIEYVHTFHGPTSSTLVYKEKAFDHFDSIFCVGPHQVREIRRREEMENLQKKTLVKTGYGLHDQLVELYQANRNRVNEKPQLLIAPSWQMDNILDTCIEAVLDSLSGIGYEIVVRPHPQYIKLFSLRIDELVNRYATKNDVKFELNFAGNESIFQSDILITDWSGIAYEFAYATLKPCVFINTPIKATNPNWRKYGIEPLDITLRDKVGVSIEIADAGSITDAVVGLLANKDAYADGIREIVREYLYYPMRSGEAAGTYIMKRLGN